MGYGFSSKITPPPLRPTISDSADDRAADADADADADPARAEAGPDHPATRHLRCRLSDGLHPRAAARSGLW
ncbi:MAG TPA: hypothetical protein VFZ66_27190 [Herpetosiphonaceae bacterium]